MATGTRVDPAEILRARTAVVVTFTVAGLAFASFMARTPSVRDALEISSAQLGLLLLCLSCGAVAGLPLSGPLVQRFGPARVVLFGATAVSSGLALLAVALPTGIVPFAGIALVAFGTGTGVWDVAMNVEGAAVELGAVVAEGVPHPSARVRVPIGMLNRHGLVAGATGTGKTKTLQLITEQLSNAGVPVFVADIKGDLSGLAAARAPGGRRPRWSSSRSAGSAPACRCARPSPASGRCCCRRCSC